MDRHVQCLCSDRIHTRQQHQRHLWGPCCIGLVLSLYLFLIVSPAVAAPSQPTGEMRWALYVTFPPAWLDPAEVAIAGLSPFWLLYALHDALVKPMPGNLMTPSLAESWHVSDDQLTYEFKLREGLRFHNVDPFTAEDVKYRGTRWLSVEKRTGQTGGTIPVQRVLAAG